MQTTDRPTYQILTVRTSQGTPNGYQVQVEHGDCVYSNVADGLFWTLEAAERRISMERAKEGGTMTEGETTMRKSLSLAANHPTRRRDHDA